MLTSFSGIQLNSFCACAHHGISLMRPYVFVSSTETGEACRSKLDSAGKRPSDQREAQASLWATEPRPAAARNWTGGAGGGGWSVLWRRGRGGERRAVHQPPSTSQLLAPEQTGRTRGDSQTSQQQTTETWPAETPLPV